MVRRLKLRNIVRVRFVKDRGGEGKRGGRGVRDET